MSMPPDAERQIRDLRAAFNRAIADGEVAAIGPILADAAHMVTGSDSVLVSGRQALLDRWTAGFRDPARLVYVRATDRVTVSPLLPIAMEYGQWRGARAGDAANWLGGEYAAKWRRIDGRWRIEAETFLTTACAGNLCPPPG